MIHSRLHDPARAALLLIAAGLLTAAPSAADTTDGTYGRLDGDLDVSFAIGSAFARNGPSAAAFARALYLGMAGFYASYTDALGADRPIVRSASIGIGMRPLFLPRWGYNLDQGPAALDLALDALTLDIGALFLAHKSGTAGASPGIECALGTEFPLLGQAAGPWIGARGALQWRPDELASRGDPYFSSTRVTALVTLSWHAIIDAHIVDAPNRPLR
jgi:hypothetical protein